MRCQYTLYTPLDRLTVIGSLRSRLTGEAGESDFAGHIDGNTFVITPLLTGRNSWRPYLWGTVTERPGGGCAVEIRGRPHRLTQVFMAVWLGIAAFLSLACLAELVLCAFRWELLLPLLFLLGGWGLPRLAFYPPANRAKKRLQALWSAAETPEI